MKRYDIEIDDVVECDNGDYVLYEDVEAELAMLKADLADLREKMEQIHNIAYLNF